MHRLSRKTASFGAVLAATMLLSACAPQEELEASQPEVIRPVKLFTIATNKAVDIRRFPGELKASMSADLAFRVGGQLTTLHAVAGQRVKKGDLLAQLDTADFQLQVDLAKANYRLATAQFSRVQAVYKQNATTKAQLDEAKASLDQAENALAKSQNQLSYTQLTAPFDGVISTVSTENFQYVNATQSLIHMQNIDQLDVVFQIPERLIANIQSSATAYQPSIVMDVAPSLSYVGQYKKHNTTPDTRTKAYNVTLSLMGAQSDTLTLLPGMTANVDVDISQLLGARNHTLVPVEAIFEASLAQGDSQRSVWVYNESTNKVELKSVVVGALQGDKIEILDGVKDGDRIVSAGVHSLTADTPVRPWTRERGL